MTECRGRVEASSALMDGELAPDEELELRRHLDVCATCAAWQRQLEALSTGVASSLRRTRAPRGLVREIARLAPRRARTGAIGASLLAAAAAAVAALVILPRTELTSRLLLDDHRRLVSGTEQLAVPSSDPNEVARDLGGRLPFRIEVERVAGAELRGGHPCTLRGRKAAYLQYERRGEPISVFVIPGTVRAGAGPGRCERIDGESLCAFAGPHETLAVVASSTELAQSFRTAAHVVQAP